MNKTTNPHYETIASAFTACSIAQPIKKVCPPDIPLISVWEQFMEDNPLGEEFCLIRDGGHTYGYIPFDSELFERQPLEGFAREGVLQIDPENIVPCSLPLLELVPLFETSLFFFILTRNEITHVVSFNDLDKLPFQFCVFSLLTELESQIIELLTINNSKIEEYLKVLEGTDNLKRAKRLCKNQYKREIPHKILLYTNFVDKKEILMRSPDLWDERLFGSKENADKLFEDIRLVRNQIAHSNSLLEILRGPSKLNKFIRELSNLISNIKDMES